MECLFDKKLVQIQCTKCLIITAIQNFSSPYPISYAIVLQEAASCPDYPAKNHTLVLENLLGGDCIRTPLEESDGSITVETALEGNTRYSFHVEVTNEVGAVESKPVQICE